MERRRAWNSDILLCFQTDLEMVCTSILGVYILYQSHKTDESKLYSLLQHVFCCTKEMKTLYCNAVLIDRVQIHCFCGFTHLIFEVLHTSRFSNLRDANYYKTIQLQWCQNVRCSTGLQLLCSQLNMRIWSALNHNESYSVIFCIHTGNPKSVWVILSILMKKVVLISGKEICIWNQLQTEYYSHILLFCRLQLTPAM